MEPASQQDKSSRRHLRAAIPYLVGGAALVLTLLMGWFASRSRSTEERLMFDASVKKVMEGMRVSFDDTAELLRAGAGLFAASESVSRQEFRNFCAQLQLPFRFPGIQGLGFAKYIRSDQLSGTLEILRTDYPDLGIRPPGDRPEYCPVVYMEPPVERNIYPIGFDPLAEQTRKDALLRARDTGQESVSAKVPHVAELPPNHQADIIVYYPVYREGLTPMTIQQRREEFDGVLFAPVIASEMLSPITVGETKPSVCFRVYDGRTSEPKAVLYSSPGANELIAAQEPSLNRTEELSFGGRPWTVVFWQVPQDATSPNRVSTRVLLLSGLALSGLLFGLTRAETRARLTAESTTRELRASQQALRDSENRFRTVTERSPMGIQIFSPDGTLISTNKGWEQMLKIPPEDLADYNILQDKVYSEAGFLPALQRAFTGKYVHLPAVYYDPAVNGLRGRPRWIEPFFYSLTTDEGQVKNVVVKMLDITRRRQVELQLDEERQISETLYRISWMLAADMDLRRRIQLVTDEATALSGAQFGVFYSSANNVPGESFEVIATSGPAQDDVKDARAILPDELFRYEGQRVIRVYDLARETQGRKSMPILASLPSNVSIRSLLAASVLSGSGKIVGLLLLAHEAPGVFTSRDEKVVAGIGAQAGVAIDNARLYERTRDMEELLSSILENSPSMVMAKNFDGRFIFVNKAFERVSGRSAAELLQCTDYDIVSTKCADQYRADDLRVLESGRAMQFEEAFEVGSQKYMLLTAKFPLRDGMGNVIGICLIATDITRRRRAEEELQRAHDELETRVRERTRQLADANRALHLENLERHKAEHEVRRLNAELEHRVVERTAELENAVKELEAFSYSVSHDLRAPLRAIDAFSRILMEDHGPALVPEAVRYLDLVRQSAQQMGRLVDDLLSFSRMSRQPLVKRPVDTGVLVQDCMTSLRLEMEGRDIEVTLKELPTCQADPTLLKQVFLNLISNSIKFTRKRDKACIEVGSNFVDGETVWYVRDNGVGFRSKYADKIFGVFQRLHPGEDYEGTGVGLAIVHRVVTRHGGRIWAESQEGEGACFYFTLGN